MSLYGVGRMHIHTELSSPQPQPSLGNPSVLFLPSLLFSTFMFRTGMYGVGSFPRGMNHEPSPAPMSCIVLLTTVQYCTVIYRDTSCTVWNTVSTPQCAPKSLSVQSYVPRPH